MISYPLWDSTSQHHEHHVSIILINPGTCANIVFQILSDACENIARSKLIQRLALMKDFVWPLQHKILIWFLDRPYLAISFFQKLELT